MQKYNIKDDVVIQLITGRTNSARNAEGRMIEEFRPFKMNKHNTLESVKRYFPNKSDDEIMVAELLRHRPVNIDRSVFQKTKQEKLELKIAKREHRLSK
jgi:hypothetical protein